MKAMKVLEMGWKILYPSGSAKSKWRSMSGSLELNRTWGLKRSDIMSSGRLKLKQGRLGTNITSGRMRERERRL
jgi:hypothetical protein